MACELYLNKAVFKKLWIGPPTNCVKYVYIYWIYCIFSSKLTVAEDRSNKPQRLSFNCEFQNVTNSTHTHRVADDQKANTRKCITVSGTHFKLRYYWTHAQRRQIICSAQKLHKKLIYIAKPTPYFRLQVLFIMESFLHAQQDYNDRCDSSALEVHVA